MGGRRINVRKAGGGVAHLHFDEVCGTPLGAGDYTAIASVRLRFGSSARSAVGCTLALKAPRVGGGGCDSMTRSKRLEPLRLAQQREASFFLC